MPNSLAYKTGVPDQLKSALRHMPSPISIVSTIDPATSSPFGLAVTAYMPVAMEPPSMQVCINRSASAHQAILAAGSFCISVLGESAEEVLRTFANPARRADRFSPEHWTIGGSLPYVSNAQAAIFCTKVAVSDFGTHTLVTGVVDEVLTNATGAPAVWLQGKMHSIANTPVC